MNTITVVRKSLAAALFWLAPDYRHPVRYSLRAAGLERSPS